MEKVRVGVIGLGHLGSLHAKMFGEIAEAHLAAVFDTDAAKLREIAGREHAAPCATLDELLNSVEAVSIATPTSAHHAVAAEALRRGVHVFIEKPITTTTDEARTLIDAAKAKNLVIQVGHIERFNPALLALEKYHLRPMFIESHRLAQFNPRGTDVAVVLDLMIHDIDIIASLVRSPVRSIEANGVAVVSESIDIANARLQFENGCVANVTASRISQKKMRKLRMFQRDAYISVDFLEGNAEVFRLVDEGDPSAKATMMLGAIEKGSVKRNIVYEQPEISDINPLKFELEQFVGAVRTKSEPLVTGEDGLRALGIAQDIMEKIERHTVQL
jgi:predicted dehydrogenase